MNNTNKSPDKKKVTFKKLSPEQIAKDKELMKEVAKETTENLKAGRYPKN